MTTSSFALLNGILYLGLGLLAMLPSLLLNGALFGMFAASPVLSAIQLAIGLWGVVAWSGKLNPVTYARACAVLFGALAAMGFAPFLSSGLGFAPLSGPNVWLHAITALAAAYFGFRVTTAAGHAERRRNSADRRNASRRVVEERRHGAYDRRHGEYGGLAAG
jgi:hypothetical protein